MERTLSASARVDIDDGIRLSPAERIIEFYEGAAADYEHWSRGLNMHLGYYRFGLNPFNRESMLEQLNLEVTKRLHLASDKYAFLIDLGCGMGAIARSIARHYPKSSIKGITLVPLQMKVASRLNRGLRLEGQIEIIEGDYFNLPFDDGSADGVWAVESACYADGGAKEGLIREMARVLKSGGRFAVADCFLKRPARELSGIVKRSYETTCRNWALTEMPVSTDFVGALERNGFKEIRVEDISWRAAPSMAHAPFAVLTFVLRKLLTGSPLEHASLQNLNASILSMVLGLHRSKFSYLLISGRRS